MFFFQSNSDRYFVIVSYGCFAFYFNTEANDEEKTYDLFSLFWFVRHNHTDNFVITKMHKSHTHREMYCIISINVAQKQTLFWSPHSTRLYVRLVNVELKLVLRPNTSNCMRVAAGAKPIRPDTFTHNTHSNIHYTRCIHIQRRGMYRLYTHTICVYRSVFFSLSPSMLRAPLYVGVLVCVCVWLRGEPISCWMKRGNITPTVVYLFVHTYVPHNVWYT